MTRALLWGVFFWIALADVIMLLLHLFRPVAFGWVI